MAAGRRFVTLDVFTDTPLAGNPLAVVLDAQDLDAGAMQAIAREFNLSETVFVLPPQEPRHRAALRIFTPNTELPFAGHPTVGTAVLLAARDRAETKSRAKADAVAFGLEAQIGTLSCIVTPKRNGGRARFRIPSLPRFNGEGPERGALAAMLGLEPADIGFSRHHASRHSAGPDFTFVPIVRPDRLDAARLDGGTFARAHEAGEVDALFLYTPEPSGSGLAFQARLFAPHLGVPEDPATGSAAAAFAGVLTQFERMGEGTHDVVIRQGLAMGRPSAIDLQLMIGEGALRAVEIGGAAVIVSEGKIFV